MSSLCLIGILALLVVSIYSVRSLWLLRATGVLFAVSDAFPRQYQLGSTTAPSFSLVVMGDSTALGQGVSRVEESLGYQVAGYLGKNHRVSVQNLAVSGARLQGVVEGQLPKLQSLQPDLILLSIGANDATHFTSYEQYQGELEQLGQRLPAVPLLFLTAPDMDVAPALPPGFAYLVSQRADHLNGLMKATLGNRSNIVDTYALGKLKGSAFYAADLFHPGPTGYGVWAQLATQRLAR